MTKLDGQNLLYDHGSVNLLDEKGVNLGRLELRRLSSQEINAHADAARFQSGEAGLFMTVPLSSFLKLTQMKPLSGNFKFQINLFATADDSQPLDGFRTTDSFFVELKGDTDLSTTPSDTQENSIIHARENELLNQVMQNFPTKDPALPFGSWNSSGWRWELGSGFHGKNEFYAADINYSSGENDRGLPVYAVADGTVVSIGETYGTVVVEHTLSDGTKWRSEYLHMLIYPNPSGDGSFVIRDKFGKDIKTIRNGDSIKRGDLVGTIGGTGQTYTDANKNGVRDTSEPLYTSDKAFGSHLHFVVSMYKDGAWKSVDMRKTIEQLALEIRAFDAGADQNPNSAWDNSGFVVRWDSIVGSFVPTDGTRIVYDREALINSADGSTPSFWKAWKENVALADMQVIAMDLRTGTWFAWDQENKTWLYQFGKRQKWVKNSNGIWDFLPEQ